MSKKSLLLQRNKLASIETTKPYTKRLAGLSYTVLPRVYGGGSDTALLCSVMRVKKGGSFWDIGTGTGLVALKAKSRGAAYVLASDVNPLALKNARMNSKKLSLPIIVKKASVFGSVSRRFDVVTFNPPFTDFKAEKDFQVCFWDAGNKTVRSFFAGIATRLTKKGRAYVCWSSFGNKTLLRKLARANRLSLTHRGRREGRGGMFYDVYEIRPVTI